MTKDAKPFDAVRMMRAIRDELNQQMRGMTFAEEEAYIRERLRSRSTELVSGASVARGGAVTLMRASASRDDPRW